MKERDINIKPKTPRARPHDKNSNLNLLKMRYICLHEHHEQLCCLLLKAYSS